MEFFGDFCLTCDRQTNGSYFCSQACRLAQLDQYISSAPASPLYHNTVPPTRTASVTSGFYLPPAFDFSSHRVRSSNSLSTASSRSYSTTSKLSEQARSDLNDYVGSFDQTRTLRRRVSMQSNQSTEEPKAGSKQ